MIKVDIKARSQRRLLIAALGAATPVLATRERGRAKSSASKRKRKALVHERDRALEALDVLGIDLVDLDPSITDLQNLADGYRNGVLGGEQTADRLQAIADDLRAPRVALKNDLAIARFVLNP